MYHFPAITVRCQAANSLLLFLIVVLYQLVKFYVLNTVKHDRVVHGIIEAELAGLKWRVDLVVFILHRNLNNTRVRSGRLKDAFRAFKIIEIEIVVQLLLLVPSKFIRFFHILKINIIYNFLVNFANLFSPNIF